MGLHKKQQYNKHRVCLETTKDSIKKKSVLCLQFTLFPSESLVLHTVPLSSLPITNIYQNNNHNMLCISHLLFSIVAITTTTTTLALECNICGPGTNNIIGKPQGVLTLNYDGELRKQNCLKWQQGSFLDEEWCRVNIMNFTVWPCGCLLADGTTLMDVLEKERQEAEDQEENSSGSGSTTDGDLPDPEDRPDGFDTNQDNVQDDSAATATVAATAVCGMMSIGVALFLMASVAAI